MSVYMTMAIRRQGRWIARRGRCAEPRSRVPYPVQVVRMRQAAEARTRQPWVSQRRADLVLAASMRSA